MLGSGWERRGLIVVAVALVAFNLRTALASLSGLLDDIRAATGMTSTEGGLLTMLPVLCMGALAPLAPRLARRWGFEWPIALGLGAVAAGCLLRAAPGAGFLYAGMAVAGAGMALANVVVPAVIKRDFPSRSGLVTALYSTAMGAGAAIAAAAVTPLRDAFGGGGWRAALAVWAAPALLAALAWTRPRHVTDAPPIVGGGAGLRHDRLAWQVSAYMGLQSLVYYVVLSWLPAIEEARGASQGAAGLLLAASMLAGIPGSLVAPIVAGRLRDQRPLVVAATALLAVSLSGMLLAPGPALLWAIVLGVGNGASFALALTLIILRSPDSTVAAELSGMAQTVGYLIAALGPLAVGAVHALTGSWSPPIVLVLVVLVPQVAAGLAAGRDRLVVAPLAGAWSRPGWRRAR